MKHLDYNPKNIFNNKNFYNRGIYLITDFKRILYLYKAISSTALSRIDILSLEVFMYSNKVILTAG